MSFATFFPTDALSTGFVIGLIIWFSFWLFRLRSEVTRLDTVGRVLTNIDQCIDQLRAQQLWRDRERIQGNNVVGNSAEFFNNVCATRIAAGPQVPSVILGHFRAIFVAGCDESSLDASELNAQTCQEISDKPEQLRNELGLMLLVGGLGTLLAQSRHYPTAAMTLESHRELPSLIWAALMATIGGVLYLQLQRHKLAPTLAGLRRKTTTLWIPRLYPTVAQRAAQWATHTLHNAARVTDASAVIEQDALRFVGAVHAARDAAEVFSGGMREFSSGIEASDRALQNAQSKLAADIDKFADSLGRWGRFEDEIRRFYAAVEAHQRQLVNEHKSFEAMLAGYYDLVRRSTDGLNQSASDIGSVAKTLPQAFTTSAEKMTEATAVFQQSLTTTVMDLGSQLESTYKAESAELQQRIQEIVQPILNIEDRLRALGTPFESASNKLIEIAENLWRLNDNFEQKVSKSLTDSQSGQSHAARSSS